jgi:hypothetical protein
MSARFYFSLDDADGNPVDPTTLSLRDRAGAFGIKRLDTGAAVIAAGITSGIEHDSTGRYHYDLDSAVAGVNYQIAWQFDAPDATGPAWIYEIKSGSDTALDDVTAAEMVSAIKTALKRSPAAVINVIVDGQTVAYDRAQAIEELKFWQREAAKEANTRPRVARIRLDGF